MAESAELTQEALLGTVSQGVLKDILMDGKINKCGVNLQIVYLENDGNNVIMELSDTINKTHQFKLHFAKPQKFELYMVVNILYDVKKIEKKESVERYKFIVKKFQGPVEEIGMILGNPKFIEFSGRNQLEMIQQSVSTSSLTTLMNLEILDEDDELLLNISEEIVGMSPEKKKENDQNTELLKYIKRDLTAYENEKLILMKENQSLLNQFQFFQMKKKEIDNRLASFQNELLAVDIELEGVEKSIAELEAKKRMLL